MGDAPRSTASADNNISKQSRRYASTSTPSRGGAPFKTAAVVGIAGVVGWYLYKQGSAKGGPLKDLPVKQSSKVFTGGDQGFVSLKLDGIEIINHNTKKLRFSFEDPDSVSGLAVACKSSHSSIKSRTLLKDNAAALLTKYQGPEDKKPTLRPYTPTSDEDVKGHLDLLVKKYPNGPMSTHLHDMAVGQRLDFKGPLPKYPWSENKHEHIALVAGGTGITPMYQLIRAIFSNSKDKTKVSLVFGNLTEEDILLKQELAKLENEYPLRFKAFYVLDNPPESWQGGAGFITKDLLKTVLPDPSQGDKVKVFVCGPPGLYKAISGGKKSPQDQGELSGYLKELGYSKDQVYKF